VRAVAQYKLVDEASLSSFQSGLRFIDGRGKPGSVVWALGVVGSTAAQAASISLRLRRLPRAM